jgi:hypothetical protein
MTRCIQGQNPVKTGPLTKVGKGNHIPIPLCNHCLGQWAFFFFERCPEKDEGKGTRQTSTCSACLSCVFNPSLTSSPACLASFLNMAAADGPHAHPSRHRLSLQMLSAKVAKTADLHVQRARCCQHREKKCALIVKTNTHDHNFQISRACASKWP